MCRKLIYLISFVVLLSAVSSVQAITTVSTAYGDGADAYIANDGQPGDFGPNSNHGGEELLRVRYTSTTRLRIGYLRFDISEVAGDMTGATLTMQVSFLKGVAKTLNVYGLTEQTLDSWTESTICYNNAPGMLPPTPLYGYYRIDANDLTLLGTITVPAAGGVFTSTTGSLPLDSLISADTNKLLTLVLIDQYDSEHEFATKENTVTPPYLRPTLTFPNASIPSATYPNPANGSVVNSTSVTLMWQPAAHADKHDVYLGTDSAAVADATDPNTLPGRGRQDPNYYPATGLVSDKIYYWRIDEVHDASTWEGDVWDFTTRDYLVVENFNSYANDTAVKAVWRDGWVNSTRAEVFLETDPNYKTDGNSMRYKYTNSNPPYYAEAYAATTALPGGIGSNWTIGDVEALVLYFYGQAGNDANEQMYVKLHDADSNKAVIYDGDMNDIREPEWHEWNIDLDDFTGVTLTNVTRITIGFGEAPSGSGEGTVFFEDIRLHPRRCALSKRSADFARADYIPAAGDCLVDYQELKIMADDWLMTSPPSYVDLYVDNKIDFKDFALLARQWLIEELWP